MEAELRGKIDELKKFLEEKIQNLKRELELYELILTILELGAEPEIRKFKVRPGERVIEVKSNKGVHLANMIIGKDYIRIIPLRKVDYNSLAVKEFLIKYLDGLRKKFESDPERDMNSIFDYEIKVEKDHIKEIMIRNAKEIINDDLKILELKAAIEYSFQ